LAESLQERGFSVDVVCRKTFSQEFNTSINVISCRWSGIFIQAIGRLCKSFLDKNQIRNWQECIFDRIAERKLRQISVGDHAITVSGLPRVMRQLRCNGGSKVLSVVNTVPFPSWLDNFPRNFSHLKEESKRHIRTLHDCDTAIFPSEAVAKCFYQLIPHHKCVALADWLSVFSGVVSSRRRGAFEPQIGYCGGGSQIKGVALAEQFARIKNQRVIMFDYKNPFNKINSQLDCRKHSALSLIKKTVDILLVPSYADAEPRVIREFISEGKIVVARDGVTSVRAPNLFLFDSDSNFNQVVDEALAKSKEFVFSSACKDVENQYNQDLERVLWSLISNSSIR
jgi:hypothetical protein